MNSTFAYLASLMLTVSALAAEQARITLYCNSVRFQPATGGPGQAETLKLTSDSNFNEMNGELSPLFNPSLPSHAAFFQLDDPTFPDAIVGQIAFDLPPLSDANGNGFDDFFEVNQGVAPSTTHGIFQTAVDNGTVTATWSRAAGSTTGTCQLALTGQIFGALPVFTHTFELLVYTGTLSYVPATNSITGMLSLALTGNTSNTLSGPLALTRVMTNRFNQLQYTTATLTNAAGLVLSYLAGDLQRDEISTTNYYGYLDFTDGDPATGTLDYLDWVLSIDDTNDANGNGIPDLSDDPSNSPVIQPKLSLAQSGRNLLLAVTAAAGQSFDVQETVSLTQPAWLSTASVTLTNSPQVLSLPLPDTPTRFWRLQSK